MRHLRRQAEPIAALQLPPAQPLGDELDGRTDICEAVDGDDARDDHGRLGLGEHREDQA